MKAENTLHIKKGYASIDCCHGFKLSSVMSDVFCKTGRRLLKLLAETGKPDASDADENCKMLQKYSDVMKYQSCLAAGQGGILIGRVVGYFFDDLQEAG